MSVRCVPEDLWQHTAPVLPGFTVEVLPRIDSTNTELMRRARAGQTEPILLIAEDQTAGKGRQGRPWSDAPGSGLMCSLALPLAPRDWSGLSLAVGVAMAQALQPTDPNAALRIGLKWPNDLWLTDDRKLGGILIETANLPQARRGERYVIIGMGVNIQPRRPPAAGPPAPASLQELGTALERPAGPGPIAAAGGAPSAGVCRHRLCRLRGQLCPPGPVARPLGSHQRWRRGAGAGRRPGRGAAHPNRARRADHSQRRGECAPAKYALALNCPKRPCCAFF